MTTTQKATHTPGPWALGNRGMVYTKDLRVAIADVVGLDLSITPKEAEANRHLIASAPELLEALIKIQKAFAHLRPFEMGGIVEKALDYVDEVIAKTGE